MNLSSAGETIVWITGASSGIGKALAIHYAGKRYRLIISGRSVDRLEAVAARCREAGASVDVLAFDIADEVQRERAVADVRERGIVPDILINNAGVSQRETAVSTAYDVDRQIIDINYVAAVHLTKRVLPDMIARGSGTVVVVSSIAAFLPSPGRSGYNGAKAAQIAFFRTLRNELHGSGITVSIVVPGFVRTEVSQRALRGDGAAYGVVDHNQANGIDPDRAARDIVYGIERRREMISTGIAIGPRVLLILERVSPRLVDAVLRKVRVR